MVFFDDSEIVAYCYFIDLGRENYGIKRIFDQTRLLWIAILANLRQLCRKCCQDSETNIIIKNQHETQMSHSIKLRTRAVTQFTSLLPSHEAVTLFQFLMITLYLLKCTTATYAIRQ